jgi:hypothetical protein
MSRLFLSRNIETQRPRAGDYGYEGSKWATNSFSVKGSTVTTTSPSEVLDHFHTNRQMKWAGIRKPRSYSNVNLSATNGWMLAADTNVGAGACSFPVGAIHRSTDRQAPLTNDGVGAGAPTGGNNWNYTHPDLRSWYTEKHLHFLKDGVGACVCPVGRLGVPELAVRSLALLSVGTKKAWPAPAKQERRARVRVRVEIDDGIAKM